MISSAVVVATMETDLQKSLVKALQTRSRKSRRKMASRNPNTLHHDSESSSTAHRVKRFHSKSRKGCLTCRTRRVKCDEQRNPNCARCDRGGYKCDWQDERPSRSGPSDGSISPATYRSSSRATLASEEDRAAHKFFSDGIVLRITALFTDMAESFIIDGLKSRSVASAISTFYNKFVPNACQSSSIVRNTLTALCGLWERAFLPTHGSSPSSHDYIARYNDVITDLRTTSIELGPNIVLITTILFANCEYLMGDLCSSVEQLRVGSRILAKHKDNDNERLSSELVETLDLIFDAFDHRGLDPDVGALTPGSDYLDTVREQHPYTDLNQANDDLLNMYSHTFAFHKVRANNPTHTVPITGDFTKWISSWKTRASSLDYSDDPATSPWLDLLSSQHYALDTLLNDFRIPPVPILFEAGQPESMFEQVTTFLQSCVDLRDVTQAQYRPFNGNVGLILPLLLVILRCGDAEKCEAALYLLGNLQIAEGLWNSCCAYKIGKAILSSRRAMNFQSNSDTHCPDESLPVAEIKHALPLDSGTEFEITLKFSNYYTGFAPTESSAIVGGFCMAETTSSDMLCTLLENGGFQGPIMTGTLQGCFCSRDV